MSASLTFASWAACLLFPIPAFLAALPGIDRWSWWRGGVDLECAHSGRLLGKGPCIPSSGQRGHSRCELSARCPSPQYPAKWGHLQPGRGTSGPQAKGSAQPEEADPWGGDLMQEGSTRLPCPPPCASPPHLFWECQGHPLQAQPCPYGSLGESEARSSPQVLPL